MHSDALILPECVSLGAYLRNGQHGYLVGKSGNIGTKLGTNMGTIIGYKIAMNIGTELI
jgi:hypothetical protein